MIEALRKNISDIELKQLKKYGNKITVRPYSLEFAIDVPGSIIKRIFELFDIWLENHHNGVITINHDNNDFLRRNAGKKTEYEDEHIKIEVETIDAYTINDNESGATVDISSLYMPFFEDLGIKVNTSNVSSIPDDLKAPIDFFSQLLEPTPETETSLALRNEVAPAVPNTQVFNSLIMALVSPQTMKFGKFTNSNEIIEVTGNDNDITISYTVKGSHGDKKASWIIKNVKSNYRKRNASNVKLFVYLFQKIINEAGKYSAYVSYQELVDPDIHIYDTVDGARRGVNNFYEYFHGREATDGEAYIPRVSIMGNFQTRDRKKINQEEQDLVIGRKITEGGQRIDFNPNINMRIFTEYVSFLPLWSYSLDNLDAFLLVQYIFFTARQSGGKFMKPDKADQNEAHPYMYFTITFESIRAKIGLPTPDNVTGRKYKEKIRQPIEKAIEDIEDKIASINDPEKSILMTLTPIGTDQCHNIEEFLNCKLEIGILATFSEKFIEAANKHEKYIEDFKKKVETQKAKKAAKSKS